MSEALTPETEPTLSVAAQQYLDHLDRHPNFSLEITDRGAIVDAYTTKRLRQEVMDGTEFGQQLVQEFQKNEAKVRRRVRNFTFVKRLSDMVDGLGF